MKNFLENSAFVLFLAVFAFAGPVFFLWLISDLATDGFLTPGAVAFCVFVCFLSTVTALCNAIDAVTD